MNKNQLVAIGVVLFLIIAIALAFLFGRKAPKESKTSGNIVIWGVFDDSDVWSDIVDKFNDSYPDVDITYQKKSIETYETDLIRALAAGRGPDIFYINNTWLPKHIEELVPIGQDYMTASQYQDIFVDVASDDFVEKGEIYAIPLYVDTLALFYNKDVFNSVGIANPPSTWEGLLAMVPSLTQKDESGNITRSAVALGTAQNINRATDILSLLMLQSGTTIFDRQQKVAAFDKQIKVDNTNYPAGQKALEFYTNFANSQKSIYTWNNQQSYSIDAFLESDVVIMLNYAYQIANIRSKSPHMKLGISLMPQFRDSKQVVNYANYWGMAVSKTTVDPELAWGFIYYATQRDQAKAYLDATGLPTARRDLVDIQRQENKDLGVFAQQSLSAYSWYQPDSTAVEKIFEEMIESTVLGIPVKNSINDAVKKVNLLIEK